MKISSLDFGFNIVGEWKVSIFPAATNAMYSTKSMFFRANHTFSSSANPTSPSEGTWRQIGNLVEWQYPLAQYPPNYPNRPTLPNLFIGNKTGLIMSGMHWTYRRPDASPGDGYWFATKVGATQMPP